MVFAWITVVCVAYGGLSAIGTGLMGAVSPPKTADASDVLAGCIAIAVAGLAAYGLWVR